MSVVAKQLDGSKIPLGTEVGLGPGHIALHGDPAPPSERHSPNFWPVSVVVKQLDGSRMPLGRDTGLGPGDIVLDAGPSSPPKGAQPQFLAYVYCGQMVAHLSYC